MKRNPLRLSLVLVYPRREATSHRWSQSQKLSRLRKQLLRFHINLEHVSLKQGLSLQSLDCCHNSSFAEPMCVLLNRSVHFSICYCRKTVAGCVESDNYGPCCSADTLCLQCSNGAQC